MNQMAFIVSLILFVSSCTFFTKHSEMIGKPENIDHSSKVIIDVSSFVQPKVVSFFAREAEFPRNDFLFKKYLMKNAKNESFILTTQKNSTNLKMDFEYSSKFGGSNNLKICIFTLGLFPTWDTTEHYMQSTLINSTTGETIGVFRSQVNETFVCHLALLPFGLVQHFLVQSQEPPRYRELAESIVIELQNTFYLKDITP